MMWSDVHEQLYTDMIFEMLQHAGFQDSVKDMLRAMIGREDFNEKEQRTINDLYQIYGDIQVLDD